MFLFGIRFIIFLKMVSLFKLELNILIGCKFIVILVFFVIFYVFFLFIFFNGKRN